MTDGDAGGVAGTAVVRVPPPPRFKAPVGEITNVKVNPGHSEAAKGSSAAQRAGLAYESRIQQELLARYGALYRRSPFVHFDDSSGARTCIPDGLLVLNARPIVIEIKSQHMPEAWWQLRRLYGPVLGKYFGEPPLLLEICRSYDPQMPFPEQPILVHDIGSFAFHAKPSAFGAMRWKL